MNSRRSVSSIGRLDDGGPGCRTSVRADRGGSTRSRQRRDASKTRVATWVRTFATPGTRGRSVSRWSASAGIDAATAITNRS
ncbi:hypothetical protein OG417_19990 [Actinoallomurus sp. NBC_01490]|nr:hypothetical protein [Actinoallomurus sp. NBC_01490]